MQGIAPAALIFLLLITLLAMIVVKLVPYLPPIGLAALCSSSLVVSPTIKADIVKEETKTEIISWKQYTWATIVFFLNIAVVSCVNGSYILAVRSGYSFQTLILISFALSVFKLLWNYLILGGWDNARLQFVQAKLTDQAIVWLCIFNNLLAPLFAEALVSSDCFVYLISQAPKLLFYYTNYACESLIYAGFLVQVCNVDLLSILKKSDANVSQIDFVPPFHYSFECSFELLSDYVYVFVFRYLLCGIIEPLIVLWLKWMLYRPNRDKRDKVKATSTGSWLTHVVPILWRLDVTICPQKQASSADFNDQTDIQDSKTLIVVNGESLRSVERWLTHKDKMKRKLTIRIVTDFSLLLAFGVLCPPLGFVIALSIVKDCWEIRLALGRLRCLLDSIRSTQDAKLVLLDDDDDVQIDSRARVCERISRVYKQIQNEAIAATSVITDGIWCSLCVSVFIWAFVLFDTLSPAVGITQSIAIVVLMVTAPYVGRLISQSFWSLIPEKNQRKSITDEVHNVMLELTSPSMSEQN
jgi:hypothetical protein